MTKPTPAQIAAAKKVLQDYLGPVQSEVAAIRALTAAAEVGPVDWTGAIDPDQAAPDATAEVGEPLPPTSLSEITNETIERCAQVVDEYHDPDNIAEHRLREIAAAIRSLKG